MHRKSRGWRMRTLYYMRIRKALSRNLNEVLAKGRAGPKRHRHPHENSISNPPFSEYMPVTKSTRDSDGKGRHPG
jgi:hypothetical protein